MSDEFDGLTIPTDQLTACATFLTPVNIPSTTTTLGPPALQDVHPILDTPHLRYLLLTTLQHYSTLNNRHYTLNNTLGLVVPQD